MRQSSHVARRFGRLGLAVAAAFAAALPVAAQRVIQTPDVSPAATIEQRIGLTDITIRYHRPSTRNRTIWGGLVPYDQVWRAGANDNTTFTTPHPLKIEGKPLAAGTYGLHMIPREGKWTVIFSTQSQAWGSFSYDEAEDALRVDVLPEKSSSFQEQLVYGFDDVTADMAIAYLHWAETKVPFQIESPKDNALAQVRNQLRHLARFSWQGWQQAANYCLQSDADPNLAMEWVEESLKREENGVNLGTKAAILRKLGRDAEATPIILKAADVANEVQVNLLGYQLLQAKDIDSAITVFAKNVKRFPNSWNAHDSLAEAYAAKGESSKAVQSYKKALGLAPEPQHARIQGALKDLGAGS